MLETAIVGGGLCGLMLARALAAQGRDFALFEARPRLGGRVFSSTSEVAGMAMDLGPTWYWPETQPRMTRLVAELGLGSFPQHDTGEVLNLVDFDKKPDAINRPNLHGGAHRVAGGMTAIIEALSGYLPNKALHFEHVLTGVTDKGDHVLLQFSKGSESIEILARHAILALPPRLVEEHVRFEPPLNGQVREAMRETFTWMADQAKAVVAYPKSFWRTEGHSGNAFVHHEHTVLGEIFDACDADGNKAALGGFFAMTPEQRASLRLGMPMLINSQMVQVFGTDAENGEQHIQDWATEPYTCSTRDQIPPDHHPEYGHPSLRQPQWNSKLHFGGSETASYGGGYLEGALEAAARIQRVLPQGLPVVSSGINQSGAANEVAFAGFGEWVKSQQAEAFERYKKQLNLNLANQVKEQIAQRAVLAAMEQVYSAALANLDEMPIDLGGLNGDQVRFEVTPKVLGHFVGFNKALLDSVVEFNRTSCAMSNFPDEHHIAPEYLETIARDLAAAWREFASNVNISLVARTQAGVGVATAA